MARDDRRRRQSSDSDGEFDWEEYERSLQHRNSYESDDGYDNEYDDSDDERIPSRRRAQRSVNEKKRKR